MKKTVTYTAIAALCASLALPIPVQATTYHISGTDLSLQLDDSRWYVFTRDNLENNAELEDLGLSYSDVYNELHNNDLYLDGLLLYPNGEFMELTVGKRALDEIVNLSYFDDEEVMEFSKGIAEGFDSETYDIYKNDYKFAYVEAYNSGLYIYCYTTVVNEDAYALTFKGNSEFSSIESAEMEEILDSVHFAVDPSLKKKTHRKNDETGILMAGLKGGLRGALIGGGAAAVVSLFKRKKKKNALEEMISNNEHRDDSM